MDASSKLGFLLSSDDLSVGGLTQAYVGCELASTMDREFSLFPQNGGVINWRSIPKYKGLEDDVVVITDVSPGTAQWLADHNQTLRNQLYVGLTRARFHAIVLVQDGLFAATHNFDGERI